MMRFRLSVAALLGAIVLVAADSGKVMLEAAKKKEVVDGDLNAAIQHYKAIVSKYPKERSLVAEALVRMADCYQKLGDAQARKIYEQVVRDYKDQNESVKLAQARLGATANATSLRLATIDLKTGRYSSVLVTTSRDRIGWQWSPDGKFIAYLSEPPDRENPALFVRTVDTGKTRELQPKSLLMKWLMPWSPDGTTLSVKAVGNFRSGTPEGLYVVDVNTGDASLLLKFDTPYITQDDEWLPDGSSFLIQISGEPGSVQNSSKSSGIYRVDAKTGEMTPLGINARKGFFVPSQDGKKIYYMPPTPGASTLIERDLTSGSERELSRGLFGPISLSPNGDYISNIRQEPGSNSRIVVLIPTRGGSPRDFRVPSAGPPEGPQFLGGWAPDGQSVFIQKIPTDKTKEVELWLVPLNGGSPKRLAGDVPITGFLWASPDGRHFLYNVPEHTR